ncbi:MAG: hypothetical protein A2Z40_03200 [Deltaproteobacteria bacterium RBG_19FT_COMBO_60_16]|nr:MAG: hypothetical protein A2Z40_03200 [Deltaproteobacteria bacterium RBG_19FT_COMBO_60_16]
MECLCRVCKERFGECRKDFRSMENDNGNGRKNERLVDPVRIERHIRDSRISFCGVFCPTCGREADFNLGMLSPRRGKRPFAFAIAENKYIELRKECQHVA